MEMETIVVDGRRLEVLARKGKLVKLDVSTYVGGDYAVNPPMEVWVREDQVANVSFKTLFDHARPSDDWIRVLALTARVNDRRELVC